MDRSTDLTCRPRPSHSQARIAFLRAAMRLTTRARSHQRRFRFCLQHGQLADAVRSRIDLLETLRQASRQWRLLLAD